MSHKILHYFEFVFLYHFCKLKIGVYLKFEHYFLSLFESLKTIFLEEKVALLNISNFYRQ